MLKLVVCGVRERFGLISGMKCIAEIPAAVMKRATELVTEARRRKMKIVIWPQREARRRAWRRGAPSRRRRLSLVRQARNARARGVVAEQHGRV